MLIVKRFSPPQAEKNSTLQNNKACIQASTRPSDGKTDLLDDTPPKAEFDSRSTLGAGFLRRENYIAMIKLEAYPENV